MTTVTLISNFPPSVVMVFGITTVLYFTFLTYTSILYLFKELKISSLFGFFMRLWECFIFGYLSLLFITSTIT